VPAPVPLPAATFARLKLALDPVQLGRRPVEPPGVAKQRDQRHQRGEQRSQLALGAGTVDLLDPFAELVLAQSPGCEMVAQLLGGSLALLIGDANLGGPFHGCNLITASWDSLPTDDRARVE
jgi:hypothetical protein